MQRKFVMRRPTQDPTHITACFVGDDGIDKNEPVISAAAGAQYAVLAQRSADAQAKRQARHDELIAELERQREEHNAKVARATAEGTATLDAIEKEAQDVDAIIFEEAEKQIAERTKAAEATTV